MAPPLGLEPRTL